MSSIEPILQRLRCVKSKVHLGKFAWQAFPALAHRRDHTLSDTVNIGPRALAFNKTNRALCKPSCTDHRGHLPKPHMRIGHHHATAHLQRSQCVARYDCMRISNSRRIETVNAFDDEMLICFKVHKPVRRAHQRRQCAFAAARKPAQHYAIEPGKSFGF